MDLRSQPVRSKLLALHLISTLITSHHYVFHMKTPVLSAEKKQVAQDIGKDSSNFMNEVKEFLILCLSRNASSVIPPVFEVSFEIFGKLLSLERKRLKGEISVFFTEIIIPILEAKKNIPWYQRLLLLKCNQKIFEESHVEGGKILVELYLNYDCDLESTSKDNIWERLIIALSKIATQTIDRNSPPLTTSIPAQFYTSNGAPGSSLTTANLIVLSREQVKDLYSTTGDVKELRKAALDLLVNGILKPLVSWCKSKTGQDGVELNPKDKDDEKRKDETDDSGKPNADSTTEEDGKKTPKALGPLGSDDPTAFESLKNRKQHILEGVKHFNFKPKKVGLSLNIIGSSVFISNDMHALGYSISFANRMHTIKNTTRDC